MRYQKWFQARFLPSLEHLTLLPDLVRFVCGYNQSNKVVRGKRVPRWAVLGQPLTPSDPFPKYLLAAKLGYLGLYAGTLTLTLLAANALGWLVMQARTPSIAAVTREAALTDMTYYNPSVDAIHRLEPAAQCMLNSATKGSQRQYMCVYVFMCVVSVEPA